ncbi:MAG TPA: peptidylprolyl isomerase [Pilimelia sp.]|nr:peptidylprolyl isomerase [Pilimelia sp.]
MNATNHSERAAARARLEKDMAERREAARRRRKIRIRVAGGVAVAVLLGGTAWVVYKVTYVPPPPTSKACEWLDAEPGSPGTKDVGKPPATASMVGTATVTFRTNFGDIKAVMDRSKAPCTIASITHLAEKGFYTGTKCHRMIPNVLQCGDPNAKGKGYRETDGQGGPSYRFDVENLPVNAAKPYPAGTLAMARRGDTTVSNGSQFFFTHGDFELPPEYTVFGKLDQASIDVVKKATKAGDDKAYEKLGGSGGHPQSEIVFKSVTVA